MVYYEKSSISEFLQLDGATSKHFPLLCVYAADWRKCTLFLGHFQAVRILINGTEGVFWPDLSLSCPIYYIYSVQILHQELIWLMTQWHIIFMLSIASQVLIVALVLSVPSTLLTPGGVEFMVQHSGPWTASEFMKPISELIEHCGFLMGNILWHTVHITTSNIF